MRSSKYTDKKFQDRTGGFWRIKQHRFETREHPIITETTKRTSLVKVLLSHNENKMLEGLTNVLQCEIHQAFRIAIFEACKGNTQDITAQIPYCVSISKKKGYTNRKENHSFKLTQSEKTLLKSLSECYGVSEKEVLRLVIIWISKSIRSEKILRLTNSPKIAQKKLKDDWSKNHDGSPSKLTALAKAQKDNYDKAKYEGQEQDQFLYDERGRVMDMMRLEANGSTPEFIHYDQDGHEIINLELVDRILQEERREQMEHFVGLFDTREEGFVEWFKDQGYSLEDAQMLAECELETETPIDEEDLSEDLLDIVEIIPSSSVQFTGRTWMTAQELADHAAETVFKDAFTRDSKQVYEDYIQRQAESLERQQRQQEYMDSFDSFSDYCKAQFQKAKDMNRWEPLQRLQKDNKVTT